MQKRLPGDVSWRGDLWGVRQFGLGAAKSAPEIRDISQTTRIHASMILAVVFYRYDAPHHWLPVAAISGAGNYSMFGLRSLACLYLLLPSAGRGARSARKMIQWIIFSEGGL